MHRILLPAALVASSLVLATAPAGSAGSPPGSPAASFDHSVTLITGDIVRVSATGSRLRFEPGPGRRHIPAVRLLAEGHQYVIPADAGRLVATGTLDRRLFDVTGLIDAGYDDARRRDLPVIVPGRTRAGLTPARLPRTTAHWTTLTSRRGGPGKIWLDGRREQLLDQSVPQIGAPAAWQSGFTGRGVKVAVLDGGIDTGHPDLADRVVATKNFTAAPAGFDAHGTHVGSTIAGSGTASGGRYKGVAPDAALLDAQVCDPLGCFDSDIIEGMEWAAVEQRADVINISLGGPDLPGPDPVEEAVNTLTDQTGALFVVAAGNGGDRGGALSSPGSADKALTVGAVDQADDLAEFSARGPAPGDGGLKPDVTAPGVAIVAAKASNSTSGVPVGRDYLRLSGTSMAAPHVAGAAALLVQQHPAWTATELKAALMGSATQVDARSPFERGAGRVDLRAAVEQSVITEPAAVSFTRASWPHDGDPAQARTVTYRNLGATAATLRLRATFQDPKGRPAPAGALAVSRDRITVPAHGTASVTVTAHTDHDGPDGRYGGYVVATADGRTAVTTPVGISKESEHHQLAARTTGPDGEAALGFTFALNLDTGSFTDFTNVSPDGAATARVPRGNYIVASQLWLGTPEEPAVYWLVAPAVTVDRDVTVPLAARTAEPVTMTVDRPGARAAFVELDLHRFVPNGDVAAFGLLNGGLEGLYYGRTGSTPQHESVRWTLTSHWADPDADGTFANSPYSYHLLSSWTDAMPVGYSRAVRTRDLAAVTSRQHIQDRSATVGTVWFGVTTGMIPDYSATFPLFQRPGSTVTQYLEPRVAWAKQLDELVPDEVQGLKQAWTLVGRQTSYRAGEHTRDVWNASVLAPDLPLPGAAIRTRRSIVTDIPLYADSGGHAGWSATEWADTKLFQDGRLIAHTDRPGLVDTTVKSGTAMYRLESAATRQAELSTRVTANWTFTSRSTDEVLPLWGFRYSPAVDIDNTARMTAVVDLPLTVQAPAGARHGKPGTPVVSVSGDDGSTWQQAEVRSGPSGYRAVVRTPPGASYISVRASIRDSLGNSAEQTVIRAYRLR